MTEERSRIDEYSVRNAILPHSVQFVTVCPHGGDDSQVTHPEVESPMGMENCFRATPIHGTDSLFIQLQFPFLKTTARPFVPEISNRTIGRFFGPIDQNLEKIKGTRFSYLSQRNLLKNEKIQFFSTVQTTPYLLQVDFDCEGLLGIHLAEEFSSNLSISPSISKDTVDLPKQRKKSLFYFGTALGFAVRPVVASISVIE
ncbi:hypothetical protein PV326_008904 [Microctonus aethiopoides]|nr:hypothetical protein PV326_008904 [Microctonus aethiopoides]